MHFQQLKWLEIEKKNALRLSIGVFYSLGFDKCFDYDYYQMRIYYRVLSTIVFLRIFFS